MWNLIISGPNFPPQRKQLNLGATLVAGRADDSDVVLPSSCISRRHIQFTGTEEGVRITDLGSRNGTLLNGRAMGKVSRPLLPGDAVTVGDYVVKVEEVTVEAGGKISDGGFVTLRTSDLENNPFMTRGDNRASTVPSDSAEGGVDPQYAPLLYELAERLAMRPNVATFLSEVLDCALGVTGFNGAFLLRDARGNLNRAEIGDCAQELIWSRTVVQTALARKSTMFVSQLDANASFKMSSSAILAQHLHVICAPLHRGENERGVMYLWTQTEQPPSQSTVDFVSAICQLAAVALDRKDPDTSAEPAPGSPQHRLMTLEAMLARTSNTVQSDPAEALRLLTEARALVQALGHELATPKATRPADPLATGELKILRFG